MTARKQISLVMMLLLFYQLNQVMLLHQHTDLQRSVLDAHIPAWHLTYGGWSGRFRSRLLAGHLSELMNWVVW